MINSTTNYLEKWFLMTKVNELIGKWESEFILNHPNNENPITTVKFKMSINYNKNSKYEENIWIMDFSQMFDDIINKFNAKGVTKDSLWETIMSHYGDNKDIIAEKYSITIKAKTPIFKIKKQLYRNKIIKMLKYKFIKLTGNEYFINEDKMKIKLVLPSKLKNLDNGNDTDSYIIYEKINE
ncbi:hypothetical protein FACS189485_21640 [Spirochaetia bacterium]|nr:hypothetical protein FACS189485_21640 [Spirochaetia bacterium]